MLAGRYSRPFKPDELQSIIGPFRTSPLGLVPKPASDDLRLIQDLSFPRDGFPVPSVNSGIDASLSPTEWGTFDDTAAMILGLPDGCVAAAFDVVSAYRIMPVRPQQQNHLCIAWRGSIYVDRAVCFGCASSAGVFGIIGDAIVRARGWGPLKKWVDDFLVVRLPTQTWTEHDFMRLTGGVGIPWSIPKLRTFSTRQKYIGFVWDFCRRTVTLPQEKREALLALLHR